VIDQIFHHIIVLSKNGILELLTKNCINLYFIEKRVPIFQQINLNDSKTFLKVAYIHKNAYKCIIYTKAYLLT